MSTAKHSNAASTPRVAPSPHDRVTALQALIHGRTAPPAPLRARFARGLTDEAAILKGTHHGSLDVLEEAEWVFTRAEPLVRANKLRGYGPERFTYAVTVTIELARLYARYGDVAATKLGKGAAKFDVIAEGRLAHHDLQSVLSTLAAGDADAERRLATAAANDRSPRSIASSIRGMLTEARAHLAATDATERAIVADAGLTAEFVDSIASVADALEHAYTEHQGATNSLGDVSRDLNLHDGRVVAELELLARLATTARHRDVSIPDLHPPTHAHAHRGHETAPAPVPAGT